MHRRHLNPSINPYTQFSYLGVPAPAEGRRRNVALGLVPSQGNGGGHIRHLNPSIDQCTQFSYLGVPAPAEGQRRNVGLGLVPSQGKGGVHWRHLNPSINPYTQSSYLGVPAPAEGRTEKCRAGACPQPGEQGTPPSTNAPNFIPWCAGHQPRVCRATPQTTPEPFHQPMHPIFIPWCAGTCRGSKEKCSAGARPQPG